MELLRLFWLLVISYLSFGDIAYVKSDSTPIDPSKAIFDQTIQAEFEILNYIKKESANLKWQDVYNILIAMSAFSDITKEYLQENSLLSAEQTKRVNELYWVANVIFQSAIERFPSELKSIFSEEVTFAVVARFINTTGRSYPTAWPTPVNAFPANMSNICIATTLSGSTSSASCNISEICWKYISQPGTRMEAAVSQLYTDYMIRQVDYCGFKLVKLAGTIAHLISVEDNLCSRIYMDFKKIVDHNVSDIHKAELLLQQITLCGGMYGYVEFVALYPLKEVFKYKTKSGCFKDTASNKRSEGISLSPSLELVNGRDDATSGNCNLHVTSVALGSLATSLRWWSFKHIGISRPTEAPKSSNGLVYAFVIVCLLLVAVIGGIAGFIIYPRFKKRKYDEL